MADTQLIITIIIVILVIAIGALVLNESVPVFEFCQKNPNATTFFMEVQSIVNCSDYLPTGVAP